MNNKIKLSCLSLACITIAGGVFAEIPAAPVSFENSTSKEPIQSPTTSKTTSEEQITLAISEGLTIKGTRPITVKIYDPVFSQELAKEKIKIDDIVVKGLAQKIKTDKGEALKIYWQRVADDKETKTQSIAFPLKSIFLSPDGIIPPATKFPAYGSKEELKNAIKSLAKIEEIKPKEKKENKETPNQKSSSSSSNYSNPLGKSRSTNDIPYSDSNKYTFPTEASSKTTFGTTTEGCEPRIDWNSEKVYPTSAQIRITDGNEERVSECTDSDIPYDIRYSYLDCQDKVDLSSMTAQAYRKAYYVNGAGNMVELKDCEPDENKIFNIEEERGACADQPDMTKGKVTETVTLSYRNVTNNRIVVSQCVTTKNSRIFDIYDSFETCGFTPDFDKGIVYKKTQKAYDKDGKTIPLTECITSDETLPLLWDSNSCNSQLDFENMRFTEIARPMVEVSPGRYEYLGVCMAKSTDEKLEVTEDGCENRHMDYLENGYSNGYVRYYQNINNTRRYLTDCMEYPKKQYQHKEEVVGYEHEDKNYRSFPIIRKYIDLPYPVGKTYITPEEINKNTSIPYVTKNIKNVGMNEFKHEGCMKFERMQKVQSFERPDKTEYYLPLEEVSPKLLGDICVLSSQKIDSYYQEQLYYDTLAGKGITNVTARGNCLYQSWTAYLGNGYGAAYKRSYTPYEVSTDIRIKTNPETGQEFREEGLTVTNAIACPPNSSNQKFSYCLMPNNADSWVDGQIVTCAKK